MKPIKIKLRKLISEDLTLEDDDKGDEKLKTDVLAIKKVLKRLLPQIDNYTEYGQLLQIILQHKVEGKSRVHKKLKDLFLAGMKEV